MKLAAKQISKKIISCILALARSYLTETFTNDPNSDAVVYSGNTYIQYEDGSLGRNGTDQTLIAFDKDVRNTINSKLGDTSATVVWVK